MELFEEQITVSYFDVDANKNIKISMLIDWLLKVSSDQLDNVQLGTADLGKRDLGWVVTQYHMKINRLPRINEKIVLQTKPTGYNRFFCYRDFWVLSDTGEVLIEVNSIWVVMNLQLRKIHEITEDFGKKLNMPLIKKGPRLPRIKLPEFSSDGSDYRVRYYDIDANHHVNNSHYFEWMIDVLPLELAKGGVIKQIDIKFDQEVLYGDSPKSFVKVESGVESTDPRRVVSYHQIKNHAQKAAEAIFTWQI